MGCDVYANCDEIACKAGMGKVIAAFPDVCLSPPSPPAGPIPVPYPDTSFSKDTMNGSKTVKIKGQEVMLKDQSFYKTAPLGDEAATQGLGAGVITHVITGKTYFVAWSMDVKFEGQNVDRHTDLTTSNHASPMANGQPPMVNTATYSPSSLEANVPGQRKCDCCGNNAHSQAQANGEHMTEDQWYDTSNPDNAALLKSIRANPKCKHLLPSPGNKNCNKYYKITKAEHSGIETAWGENSAAYREFQGVPAGTDIAHRVPKTAGGCPYGQKNLAPTGNKCAKLETKLSTLQQNRTNAIGRA